MNEKDTKKTNKGRLAILLAVSAVSVLILIVVWNLAAPFLIDNDNIYLKTVASGEMTGTPEPHMYY
nr:hypothetical protein [Lachnospiraceae bacterium]